MAGGGRFGCKADLESVHELRAGVPQELQGPATELSSDGEDGGQLLEDAVSAAEGTLRGSRKEHTAASQSQASAEESP